MAARQTLFSPLLIYLEQGSVFLYNARLVSPVMPSNRHSYTVLAAACACVLAVCAFLFWQNRQKKNKLARQYAELSMPPPAHLHRPDMAFEPFIVTAELPGEIFSWVDGLRRAHFPPERNHLSAHVTLFHALPPWVEAEAFRDHGGSHQLRFSPIRP